MLVYEVFLRVAKRYFDFYVNEVFLAENLSLATIVFFRALPWISLTTLVGLSFKYFHWQFYCIIINLVYGVFYIRFIFF
jgi:hypothetical protein